MGHFHSRGVPSTAAVVLLDVYLSKQTLAHGAIGPQPTIGVPETSPVFCQLLARYQTMLVPSISKLNKY